jgi:hypothetical protein
VRRCTESCVEGVAFECYQIFLDIFVVAFRHSRVKSHATSLSSTCAFMNADSDATHTRTGRTKRYTWSETVHEIELRLPLPVGTKRSQLAITLHDDASGANLWRTEIETIGGRENHAERALLRVRPAFWPDPLVDGVVRGAVDPLESSYQLVATGGNDAWDCLVISLRKAESAKGWWGGVVHDEAPADAEWPAAATCRATRRGWYS